MDVLQETNLAVPAQNLTQVNGADERGTHEHGGNLKPYAAADAAVPLPSSAAEANAQRGSQECQRAALTPPSPLSLNEHAVPDESSTHAISLTSCTTKVVSPWSMPEDCDKAPFPMMVPGGISNLTGDCLMQPSRTCLGCFIETKDTPDSEPEINLKMGDMSREYDPCSIPDIGMQCMSSGDSSRFGDQLLSDQLLSYPEHKVREMEKRDTEKSDSDSEDPTSKSIYEGLLLDKCNGEEALLTNPSQDWGCFESFISESKMELLDLCSKNELSVNLFSEEDVDNYMFDDDDDSTLSSDVCSLKIRYESFQDNVREKTNALQEEAQFNFFPSVLVNYAKKEGGAIRKNTDGVQLKGDDVNLWGSEDKGDKSGISADGTPDVSSESNYLFDSNTSTEDSGEYSDDSSCTGSSYDTLREAKGSHRFLSRENSSSSSQLNYGLRAKRKVRYSEDYLYDVDSIESERNTEKREKQPSGPKEEEDDDWCPKKRRKSSRKEPPVVIKYIIINRFKGERHMLVKARKIDPTDMTVSLNEDLLQKYEKLAPLKEYWQKRQQERQERCRLALGDKHKFCLNGCRRSFSSSPPKRKYKIANRLRIQRIQTVEQSPNKQGPCSSDHKQEGSTEGEAAITNVPLTTAASSHTSRLDQSDIMDTGTVNSRSQEREDKRTGNKIVRIRKFRSEARLRSKKIKCMQEDSKSMKNLPGICPVLENQNSVRDVIDTTVDSAASKKCSADSNEKSAFRPATCSPDKGTPSVNVAASVSVVPGGYLQTLLDASESSSSTGISYFPQQHSRQYPLGVSPEEKQFASLQLAQSCVLSPPSESELQQSPQNCTNQMEANFTQMWHTESGSNQPPFEPDIPESTILPNGFSGPMPMSLADNMAFSEYSQVNLDGNRVVYEKNDIPEQPLQPNADYQACRASGGEGNLTFQRGVLNTDNGRLISFDSVGSLSASSSNYSSLSLKSCEKDTEDDMNDNFLAHCSPKLVIQQSVDEITPLRESTDLLDISNFTPDKFRHSSLSEMSPPDTPNLSPQVTGPEMKGGGKAKDFQDASEVALGSTAEMKWDCSAMPPQVQHGRTFTVDSHQFQFHTFSDDDGVGLAEKNSSFDGFDEQNNSIISGTKGPKSKKKTGKQNSALEQKGTKKTKAPRAAKAERSKSPRQNSRSTKKIKALLDGKAAKGQAGGSKTPPKFRNNLISAAQSVTNTMTGSLTRMSGDWPSLKESGTGWSEGSSNLLGDDQREFEEPSNILSNIASGMAEVQRFMMASIEPLWSPGSGVCLPPEANSLKLKTLKILAGTPPDLKKKGIGTTNTGATRGRKSTGRGGKNQAKLNSSHPFFPPLALDCNMFDRPSLGIPGTNGPPHKKMYRHKTSAKFTRDENSKGKRADPNKDLALMASFEKLR
ncbi:neurite extension and migration factor-like [Megalops cyprinoides]|uniref:neurite extension and migration factor-like n=1 Tax=Megalops cyprinoides TaxID=118141 RepID=UPI0018641544|nr:neurite extension and migration factor-like [Megalops cyprinoides]